MAASPRLDLDAHLRAVAGRGPILIVTHDNPDPDSLACAEALRQLLAAEAGVEGVIGFGGIIGRAENRALVEVLDLGAQPIEAIDVARFPLTALIDTQPHSGNNSLPPGRSVDIVLDHHPPRPESAAVPWCDIQPDLGASSTIAYQYLLERRLPIDARLASALLYAIKSETRDLCREATVAERNAYADLVTRADDRLLYAIFHPKVPAEHFAALDRALHRATLYGELCVANLGQLDYPDLVAEIADLLLPLAGVHWVMCVGRYADRVFLSVRTDVVDARCGALMRRVVGDDGAAGGHGLSAGGRLHAPVASDKALGAAYDRLVDRLITELKIPPKAPRPLLPQ